MRLLTTTLALFSAAPLALGLTGYPSAESLPAAGIFARQEFVQKTFCYPVQEVKNLRPGKTVDVNKLVELVKVETNDILMVKQSCTVFTCYNNIGINICNFDSKDIVVTALQLAIEITEVSASCNEDGLTAGVKSSNTGYTITVGSIDSIKPGWSCA
ncbi:hypothetical protein V496_04586 [Pseudogymnoascus sp. VKM F-4515 (FW-2607)]|nr:hypothetical protein V496_04586 [Pseudogymnoascus sp. VKM F-4515 (FW-2607)]KFY91784.1 hypothetical protein V498_05315 [Pseudogymnoascus sp. VKM F-4517 (FW-2822)]